MEKYIKQYEEYIEKIMSLFESNFNVINPIKKWRNGKINRIGTLDKEKLIVYSLHGAGCTVEFEDGTLVSFDFDTNDNYIFDDFKFKMFVESVTER